MRPRIAGGECPRVRRSERSRLSKLPATDRAVPHAGGSEGLRTGEIPTFRESYPLLRLPTAESARPRLRSQSHRAPHRARQECRKRRRVSFQCEEQTCGRVQSRKSVARHQRATQDRAGLRKKLVLNRPPAKEAPLQRALAEEQSPLLTWDYETMEDCSAAASVRPVWEARARECTEIARCAWCSESALNRPQLRCKGCNIRCAQSA